MNLKNSPTIVFTIKKSEFENSIFSECKNIKIKDSLIIDTPGFFNDEFIKSISIKLKELNKDEINPLRRSVTKELSKSYPDLQIETQSNRLRELVVREIELCKLMQFLKLNTEEILFLRRLNDIGFFAFPCLETNDLKKKKNFINFMIKILEEQYRITNKICFVMHERDFDFSDNRNDEKIEFEELLISDDTLVNNKHDVEVFVFQHSSRSLFYSEILKKKNLNSEEPLREKIMNLFEKIKPWGELIKIRNIFIKNLSITELDKIFLNKNFNIEYDKNDMNLAQIIDKEIIKSKLKTIPMG